MTPPVPADLIGQVRNTPTRWNPNSQEPKFSASGEVPLARF